MFLMAQKLRAEDQLIPKYPGFFLSMRKSYAVGGVILMGTDFASTSLYNVQRVTIEFL